MADIEIELGDESIDLELMPEIPVTDYQIEEAYENKSLRVIYQSNTFFLPQLADLIQEREILNLRPEYQRRLRWSRRQKSLLIESLLLNIPIPPVFFYESDLARYEVMDGQQRINSIHEFLNNDFALFGLQELSFLNRKRYRDLPPKVKRGLDRASLSATVLLKETIQTDEDPYQVRRYVFERLNTGGKKLNAQEMRNSIYQGDLNEAIIQLSRSDLFCHIFGIPEYTETDENEYYENPVRQKNSLYSTMKDCEIVLRSLALENNEHIKGAMKKILNNFMERNREISETKIHQMKYNFNEALNFWYSIMEKNAFLLPPDAKGKRRLSVALFDASMAATYRLKTPIEELLVHKKTIKENINQLVKDPENEDLIVGRRNTAQAIIDRITLVQRALSV